MQIIKYSKVYLAISMLILFPGIIALGLWGLKLDIDFTGGSVFEYEFSERVEDRSGYINTISSVFEENEVEVKKALFITDTNVELRTPNVEAEQGDRLTKAVQEKLPDAKQVTFETVGPAVGAETTESSFKALAYAAIAILLYIAYAFRNIPKPYSSYRFGATALISMLHDALTVIGIFAILGHFYGIEIDALFITAVLTVIGFSVHDTIVVFDRIRENLRKLPSNWSFSEVVNYSLVETLNRSVATSLTVVIVLASLFLLGGTSIRDFSMALLIGIVSGTYSSIFVASPIIVIWENLVAAKKTKKR